MTLRYEDLPEQHPDDSGLAVDDQSQQERWRVARLITLGAMIGAGLSCLATSAWIFFTN